MKQARLIVAGRVQGVFFRANTKKKADALGLKGWCRNVSSGTEVEIVVQGELPHVEQFIDWCRTGPLGARVSKIQVEYEEPSPELKEFEIKY
jgi:acylphosphatase